MGPASIFRTVCKTVAHFLVAIFQRPLPAPRRATAAITVNI